MSRPDLTRCQELLFALNRVNRVRRWVNRDLSGNRQSTLLALHAVEACGGSRVSAIADRLLLDVSAASRRIAALEADGLVERIRDSEDHRSWLVRTTPAGQNMLAEMTARVVTDLSARLDGWSDHEVEDLALSLNRLATGFGALDENPDCHRPRPGSGRDAVPIGAGHRTPDTVPV